MGSSLNSARTRGASWRCHQYRTSSEPVQTPGHSDDLGLELAGSLYFQSKDGAINDDPSQPGGFFGQLQYAVMFPLDGLGYQAAAVQNLNLDTSAAQLLRVYLGIIF
jgi:hypothetical protein